MQLLADVRPLRQHPPFRRLWAGSALSSVGTAMTGFAVPLQIYELTHSVAAVGALGLARALPAVGLGLLGGSIADAADRRRLVLATSSGLAAVSALLALQAYARLGQAWLLYALVTVQSLLASVDNPARRTFVPRLLPGELVPAGLALNQLSFQVSFTLGPALGGLLAAGPGLRACYLVDALSFLAAVYGVAGLPAMVPERGGSQPGLRAVAAGLRFIRRHRVLAGTFLADLDAMVLGMPFALLPAINVERLHGDARTLGLLTAAPAVGGLAAAALSGPVARARRPGRGMLAAVVVWGAGVAGLGLAGTVWVAALLLALAGAADNTSVVFRATIVQLVTPDRLRGRVSAADYVVGAGGPQLGNVRAGVVGALASPAASALWGGVATILGAVLIRRADPALARYERPAGSARDA